MAKDNYGLLLASIVAIVAIVGLVILFSGKAGTGASVTEGQYMLVQQDQGQYAKVLVPEYPVDEPKFGVYGSGSGSAVDMMSSEQRSFMNWCLTFPDVCCKAYPNECQQWQLS